ncbi:MAG TPA: 30S ribosomal protein S6 [bacterium (Candidatus Stahlbacteria)]|nr:30S ribosomal protein S6 [Candidatus Stahlbacteria bacterium]
MHQYEAVFILHPKLEEENREKEVENLKKFMTKKKAEILKVESLGRKKFSYPIKKLQEGDYILFEFKSPPTLIDEIKDQIKHSKSILRSMFLISGKER